MLGGCSMILWSLVLLVLVKYVIIALSMDDNGEGGAFALYSLICRTCSIDPVPGRSADPTDVGLRLYVMPRWERHLQRKLSARLRRFVLSSKRAQRALLGAALVAVCLMMADGVLTPAVSVISAIEGIRHQTGLSDGAVVGTSCCIIVALFSFQSKGTSAVSRWFSPVMVCWFLAIGGIGLCNLLSIDPSAAEALSPLTLVRYVRSRPLTAWRGMGSAMLAITGAEALFADLGHFDAPSVRLGFVGFVLPCLALSYLGQTAVILHAPEAAPTAFWSAVPAQLYWPMVALATVAAVIASQALITGCFSIVQQAIALSCFPRVTLVHTNPDAPGQIYSPEVNALLATGTLLVTLVFRTGPAASAAYGLGIACTFLLTTFLFSIVMLLTWELPIVFVVAVYVAFSCVEATFVSSNLLKVPIGAWFMLVTTCTILAVLSLWTWGQNLKASALLQTRLAFADLVKPAAVGEPETAGEPRAGGKGKGEKGSAAGASPAAPAPSSGHHALAPASPRALQSASAFLPSGRPVLTSARPPPLVMVRTETPVARAKGVGVYLSETLEGAPPVLCTLLSHFPALHEVVVVLTIRTVPVPVVDDSERYLVRALEFPGFFHAVARFGYTEEVRQDATFVKTMLGEIRAYLSPEIADEQAEALARGDAGSTLGTASDRFRKQLAAAAREIAAQKRLGVDGGAPSGGFGFGFGFGADGHGGADGAAHRSDSERRAFPFQPASSRAPAPSPLASVQDRAGAGALSSLGADSPRAAGGEVAGSNQSTLSAPSRDLSLTPGSARGDGKRRGLAAIASLFRAAQGLEEEEAEEGRASRDGERRTTGQPVAGAATQDDGTSARGLAAPLLGQSEAGAAAAATAAFGSPTASPPPLPASPPPPSLQWVQQPSRLRADVRSRRSRPPIPRFGESAADHELEMLDRAERFGVSFLVGHSKLVAGDDRNALVRGLVNVAYGTLIDLAQPRVAAYKIAPQSVVEIVVPIWV